MAKYMVRCETCGKEFRVDLIGKTKDREWKLENLTWVCDECREAAIQKQNAEAAAANAEEGLPPLKGSEKQIAWAETLRVQAQPILDEIKDSCRGIITKAKEEGDEELQKTYEEGLSAIEYIANNPYAKYWIENRFRLNKLFFAEEMERVLPQIQEREEKSKEEELPAAVEAKAEATVRPEEAKTETVAEIGVSGETITISFPERREDFRKLVKMRLGYRWNGKIWARKITQFSGPVEDRVAETGSKLLLAGFPIRIFDETLRLRAVNAEYEPEQTRWVQKSVKTGFFMLVWSRDEDYYRKAIKLPGAKYNPGMKRILLPPESCESVLDFAEAYDFKLSPGALELFEAGRALREKELICAPKEPEPVPTPEPEPEPEEYDIDESLRDDN